MRIRELNFLMVLALGITISFKRKGRQPGDQRPYRKAQLRRLNSESIAGVFIGDTRPAEDFTVCLSIFRLATAAASSNSPTQHVTACG
jgi:hypothetical protein